MTVHRVEFGFGRAVDMVILKSLIEELSESEEKYLECIEDTKTEKERVITSRQTLRDEIEELKENLKTMEESLKVMDEYIKKFNYRENISKSEMDTVAKKIVYSNIYRKEMEECIN
ncbi:MAG: hypothetical protein ACRDDY_18535 [Clostridium sp.]|uniref:hypothetical protein n=1 Tax=Clostridium sp. TaxID=1506 RepID=UPI003EE7B673